MFKKIILFILSFLVLGFSYVNADLTDGLLGKWELNGNANDTSGNENNGIANNIEWTEIENVAGKYVADFNGINSYIDLPSGLMGNKGSFGAWFKAKNINSDYLIFGSTKIYLADYLRLRMLNGQYSVLLNIVYGTNSNYYNDNLSIIDTNWHYGFISWNNEGNWKYYFDGNLVYVGEFGSDPTNNYRIKLGVVSDGDEIYYYNPLYFEGSMKDVVMYNRQISDYEVQQLYQEGNPSSITLQTPINLKQYIESPYLYRQEIGTGTEIGTKIGKYQSGSGIILSASVLGNDTGTQLKLAFEVYKYGSTTLTDIQYATGIIIGSKEVVLPYYGSGSYYWRVRTEDDNGNVSDWINYGTDNQFETDYELFEGFEPYPYGYKFVNRHPAEGVLTGSGYYNHKINIGSPYEPITIVNEPVIGTGNKWEILKSAFDTNGFSNNQLVDLFINLGLNNDANFTGGNCYGMASSAAMQYAHPDYLHTYYRDFSDQIGTGKIRDNINSPRTTNFSTGVWDIYNDTLKTILAFQLSYKTEVTSNKITGSSNVLKELKDNPDKTYIMQFKLYSDWGSVGHAVIPYKVEGNKVYIWDNDVPYPYFEYKTGIKYANYQYIEVTSTGFLIDPLYGSSWKGIKDISLIDIDKIYHGGEKLKPRGYNVYDLTYSLNGKSDLIVTDSEGRVSGFSGGTILEEIPGVEVEVPINDIIEGDLQENTWKQIYLPQKQDLTVKVIAKGEESYDLMIAGGYYFTNIENVETSTGQIDTFESTVNNLKIDFDDTKTGLYNLLTDNFQENNTGTIYIDSVKVISNPQQYGIDWSKVQTNEQDAVTQQIDINNDGIYNGTGDTTITLPPVFQDLLAPTTSISFSGNLTLNQTGTYIETVTIDLNAKDNEGGSGVDKIYYSLDNTGITDKVYTPYTTPIIVNGVNNYTLSYYSVDKFGNKETVKTENFTLTEKIETNNGEISGYVYDDINSNGIKDTGENTMAGWKICIDKNNNGTCEENSEPFIVTNNQGYYEFNGLAMGIYKILETSHQNWIVTNPSIKYYTVILSNGQKVSNKNFGNLKTKGIISLLFLCE